jgi:cysteinyl-tRNA synthetase
MDALGIQKPDFQPKATESLPEIIDLIRGLIEKGFAYHVDGDVYFSVSKAKNYTKLSGMNLDEMETGKRIEASTLKDEPLDFALWKKAKKGEIFWDSPWGAGRPGWHIECSAMSMKYLGETIDIHGGGQDLIFPHHSNEIAQSECYTGKKFVKYWVHNGFVTVNKAKMSKSLKNFSTIRELLKRYDASTLRFFLLSTHYRSQIDFADIYLEQAKTNLNKLLNTINNIKHALGVVANEKETANDKKVVKDIARIKKELLAALDDDFNTSIALAKLFELAKLANKYIGEKHTSKVLRKFLEEFEDLDTIFNLFNPAEPQVTEEIVDSLTKLVKDLKDDKTKFKTFGDLMELVIEIRDQARTNKDYDKSDRIRNELDKFGIILEDTKKGVKWKLKR